MRSPLSLLSRLNQPSDLRLVGQEESMGLYTSRVKVSVGMHQTSPCRGASHALRNGFVGVIALLGPLLEDQAALPGTAPQSSPLPGTPCQR